METETLTVRDSLHTASCIEIEQAQPARFRWSVLHLTMEHLQDLVQAAYDQYGILATPSYETEATAPATPACTMCDPDSLEVDPWCPVHNPAPLEVAHNVGVRA